MMTKSRGRRVKKKWWRAEDGERRKKERGQVYGCCYAEM